MKQLSRKTANITQDFPERILQFGGGNFLRGFVDWIIDKYNRQSNDEKLGILAVKVRKEGSYQRWKDQDGLFHLISKGYSKGRTINEKILISSVVRILEAHEDWDLFLKSAHQPALNIIISNTTETGLNVLPSESFDSVAKTFPGQLCHWLFERYQFFQGDKKAGCTILPCELLNDNGEILKNAVLEYANNWGLEQEFKDWVEKYCHFCNTLVDRIVPGIDQDKVEEYYERIGFEDQMITESEPYHLWAIETNHDLGAKLPLNRIGLNVIYTEDLFPFRERKLKILNGAHSAMVPIGMLLGIKTVKEVMEHELLGSFVSTLIYNEIVPSLELDEESSITFAEAVLDRFRNPFLKHHLESISLYSIAKFNTRLKPTLKAYVKKNKQLPKLIVTAFSSLLIFYSGKHDNNVFTPHDQDDKIEAIQKHWNEIRKLKLITPLSLKPMLGDEKLWQEDLNKIPGLSDSVSVHLGAILEGNLKSLLAIPETE